MVSLDSMRPRGSAELGWLPSPKFRLLAALILSLLLMAGGIESARSTVTIEPVITGRASQYFGSANDEYIAYTQWKRASGELAWARPIEGGTGRRLNAGGTLGNTGGFDPGTNRIILQQYKWGGRSDLYFYDLDTDQRSKVPGVNSRRWEALPRISSTFVAFLRARPRHGTWYTSLLVHRRASGATRTLGTWKEPPVLMPSSVGDRYVTYTLCTRRNCFAYLYDWITKAKVRIPTENDKPQYGPVVDEVNSTVYFARSGHRCGRNVNIWRLPISLEGEATKIVALPRGIDTGWTASLTANSTSGEMDLYIDRWDCAAEQNDIYVVRGVDAGPSP